MLADGSVKLIDEVTLNDQLKTFNLHTGIADGNSPIYVLKHEDKDSVVITLTLDNGKELSMCDYQQFFDMDEREYVEINDLNYEEAINSKD